MIKPAKWWSEKKKKKINAVFKFYLTVTKEAQLEWEKLRVSFFPVVAGKPGTRPEKAVVLDGSPIYITTTLTPNPKTGKINDKVYLFVLSATDSAKFGIVGETEINLANYAEATKSVSLTLKGLNAGILLQLTIQRVHGEAEGRGFDEDGDAAVKQQRRTLWRRLSNSEIEEGKAVSDGANDIKTSKEISSVNSQARMKFSSSRTVIAHVKSLGNGKSRNSDGISASGSDSNLVRYTGKENGTNNNINHHCSQTLLFPISNADNPRDSNDSSVISTPYRSIDGSNTISVETLLRASQESDNLVEHYKNDVNALTSQLEVAKPQTLQKQVVKKSMQAKDLAIELQSMKEERDVLGKESEELKASKNIAIDEENVSAKLDFGGKDPWSMLEEAKQELNNKKKLNADLQLELNKLKESNSELILATRNLEERLQQKNKEICSCGCGTTAIKTRSHQLNNSECQQDEDHEHQTLDQKIELTNYKKKHEELEMQMEQLALDYEILKQENHDISTKLEQTQLCEQLRMQFDYSSNLVSISELEAQIESLENELVRQAEVFQADLEIISRAKVEQEKRTIQAEEALRKTILHNYNAAEQLQEEFKRLTLQMSAAFDFNEKLVMQTLKEFSNIHLQKCQVEEMLKKRNEEFELVRQQNNIKCQQLLKQIDFKTQEIDSLQLELQEKFNELEDKGKSEEEKQRASSEQIAQLKAEIEIISRKNDQLSEKITLNQNLIEEMGQQKASIKEIEMLLQDHKKESAMLEYELALLKEVAKKTQQELNDLRQVKIKNDADIDNLNAEVAIQKAHYTDLKHSMKENELEKENLRKQVLQLRAELLKEAKVVGIIENKINDHKENLTDSARMKPSTRTKKYKPMQAQLHFQDAALEEGRSCGNYLQNPIKEGKTQTKDLNSIDMGLIISDIFDIFTSEQKKKAEVLREKAKLKEQNNNIETELKEMHERYSHMSLKFAEVEGERQQLVLKIRSLKKNLKIKF
ncbi:hypothetical protein M5K25_009458 [Dendrobium thyrsiflorum]|uniref:C2 NT-type domain-containing protein n=1 Tax=Dendrobium thyrsiflorum TaxID=117978 RepID=A0ABD0V6D0_DENTH